LLPIVHAEADYKGTLCLGDKFSISLKAEIGQTSFALACCFTDTKGNIAAEIRTVHVSVDKRTGAKIPLPEEVRKGLQSIC
jgi:acyl-CoA thioesterase FadM